MFIIPYRGQFVMVEARPRLKVVKRFSFVQGMPPLWSCSGAGLTFIRETADEAFTDWLHVHVYQLRMIQQGLSPLNTNESLPS